MSDSQSLADRLNKMAKSQREEQEREQQQLHEKQEATQFIYQNARAESDRLVGLLDQKIADLNPLLTSGLPMYEHPGTSPYVKQGAFAVQFSFSQIGTNFGPIRLMIAFGREPRGFYLDQGPRPERLSLEPAMEHNPSRIVWYGDIAPLPNGISSENLIDLCLERLTQYYLANH
jgi:hypothetical protein